MRQSGVIFLLLSFSLLVNAQFVDYGTDPARFRWQYVQTPHYKVIYPKGTDSLAYRYALFLETVYPHLSKTIGKPVKGRYPAVLHPGNMLSNGLVAWAPRRMELIPTPSPGLYAQSWDRQLSIHESRHVFQTGKLMKGIFRPLYFIAGEQVSGLADFAIPRWFFEGDATVIETAMSNSGRGRLPEFHMAYRAQVLSGKPFSFDKWFLGSYKDYTGNFYALGYNMTAYARYEYGADIWDKVTDRYTHRILHLPPFSSALKHYTGVNIQGLFNRTFEYLEKEWQEKYEQEQPFTKFSVISPPVTTYISYQYPQVLNDSTVIALKTSLSDIQSIVMIRSGIEEKLTYTGNINSRLILQEGVVYWTEYIPGIRWTHENHSVLKSMDLSTGKIKRITSRGRYLTPALSPAGKYFALSRPDYNNNSEIVILDKGTGEITHTLSVPAYYFVKDLCFTDENLLAVLLISDAGISIQRVNISSGNWEMLLAPGSANIHSIISSGGDLYFESGLNGVNNIYRLEPEQKKVSQITSARFGMFQPATNGTGDILYVADYTAQGYRIAAIKTEDTEEKTADFSSPYTFPLARTIASQEAFNLDTAGLDSIPFEPHPYRKLSHLFNIHSWAPFYYDVTEAINLNSDDFTTLVKPGAMILSQNQLNTLITQVGAYYKDNDWHGKLSLTYMGLYPVFDVIVDYGGKPYTFNWTEDNKLTSALSNRTHLEAEVSAYIPFNFSNNDYTRGFQPSVSYYYTNNRYEQYLSEKMEDFRYLLSELRFYTYRKMAQRDLLPRWGYQLRLQYLHAPFQSENFADLYGVRLTTYLPGVYPNHSLMVRAGYQYQPVENKTLYMPKALLEKPRGYAFNVITKHQYALKADYAFSLFCPDVSLGTWAYIRRVRTNLFYDISQTQASKHSDWVTQSSFGGDLIADWNIFRLNYPISTGIRLIEPLNYGSFQTEVLFSVSF